MSTLRDNIKSAMGAHEVWKKTVWSAIATGKPRIDRAMTRRDDACAFGRWLLNSNQTGPRRERIAELHRRFHVAAAHALDAALAGKKREALRMLEAPGEYAALSSALMREMADWHREADLLSQSVCVRPAAA